MSEMKLMNTWKVFSEKIDAGHHVRWNPSWKGDEWMEGILLENKPYSSSEMHTIRGLDGYNPETDMRLKVQPFETKHFGRVVPRVEVTSLQYLIDNEWLNFWQVTTR